MSSVVGPDGRTLDGARLSSNGTARDDTVLYASPPKGGAGRGTPAGRLLQAAAQAVEGERQIAYGSPTVSMAVIARYWTLYLSTRPGGAAAEVTAADVCRLMELLKIARGVREDDCMDASAYSAMAFECAADGNPGS